MEKAYKKATILGIDHDEICLQPHIIEDNGYWHCYHCGHGGAIEPTTYPILTGQNK